MSPFELFAKGFPQLAERFDQLVDAQRALSGLDGQTKQLIKMLFKPPSALGVSAFTLPWPGTPEPAARRPWEQSR